MKINLNSIDLVWLNNEGTFMPHKVMKAKRSNYSKSRKLKKGVR